MLNTLKTIFILACFPLLLMATLWGVLATLVIIVCFALWLASARITFAWPPTWADIVPRFMWDGLGIAPVLTPRPLHTLPADASTLWNYYAPLINQTTIDAAPWLLGIALLWVIFGLRYEGRLIAALSGSRGLAHSECPPLYDVLEELCEKNNMPMPRLYLARELPANAFASGIGRDSYAITVTAGLIGTLDRNEVKAVLAHELSHIRHGDVRLLVVATMIVGIFGWAAGTLWRYVTHSLMGYPTRYNTLLFSLPFVMLLAMMLSLGGGLSELLKRIMLREREMGADAGAAVLTNDPSAMASALEQIASAPVQLHMPRAIRDMLIYNAPRPKGFGGWWQRLWSTHPPLNIRLAALQQQGARPRVRGPSLVTLVVRD